MGTGPARSLGLHCPGAAALWTRRPADLPHVVSGVRHDADLAPAQAGIGLDPIDQRGAPRRRREEPFDDDEVGALIENGLQRLDRLRVRKRLEISFICKTFPERGHQVGGGNDDR